MTLLFCGGCDRYLGDNNEPVKNGPHAGARPTDMTVSCEVTGKQEQVVRRDDDTRQHADSFFAKMVTAAHEEQQRTRSQWRDAGSHDGEEHF
jgi:hypothetical protein